MNKKAEKVSKATDEAARRILNRVLARVKPHHVNVFLSAGESEAQSRRSLMRKIAWAFKTEADNYASRPARRAKKTEGKK